MVEVRLIVTQNIVSGDILFRSDADLDILSELRSINFGVLVRLMKMNDVDVFCDMIDWCWSNFHHEVHYRFHGYEIFKFKNDSERNWFLLKWS